MSEINSTAAGQRVFGMMDDGGFWTEILSLPLYFSLSLSSRAIKCILSWVSFEGGPSETIMTTKSASNLNIPCNWSLPKFANKLKQSSYYFHFISKKIAIKKNCAHLTAGNFRKIFLDAKIVAKNHVCFRLRSIFSFVQLLFFLSFFFSIFLLFHSL